MQDSVIQLEDYCASERFKKIKAFADTKPTPFVIIDSSVVATKYGEITDAFPYAKIYFAVKANPDRKIISLLHSLGANFDIASIYELDRVLDLGISPDRCSYGNTIKKQQDIRYFYNHGVRLFASDSENDLHNIAEQAPGSKVYIRVLTEGSHTADWPLSRKFGCQVEMAIELIALARDLGLIPYGLSFHVGSQQRDIGAWDAAIGKMKIIFDRVAEEQNITLKMLNLGGGFPASYLSRTHGMATYAEEITRYLQEDFGDELPEIILEPGRSLCADAGTLVSEVVLISRKSHTSLHRWVFTDVGKFSGMIETWGEAIKYPLYMEKQGPYEEAVIAGPTCDSADILYEDYKYSLPLSLEAGDRFYWLSTGAYTTSYSAIEFNGFPPLQQYVID